MDQVGQEVKRLREEKGWSQAKLAVAADMSVSGVSQIENGKRNLSTTTLIKLARALETDVANFFPKAQASLPLEEEDARRRGYQSIAEFRTELLEDSAELWEKQLLRDQYDLETIRGMDDVAFKISMNHRFDEQVMKLYCTPEQHELLEHAEEKFAAIYQVIWSTFKAKLEEEAAKARKEQVVDLERYKNELNERRARLANTGT